MAIIKRIATTLALLAFCLGAAHGANAQALSSGQVERFIASMPELTELGEMHDDKTRRKIDSSRPLGSSLELMGPQDPAYAALVELASRHGFSSVEQWADVGDRTVQAYQIAASGYSDEQVQAGRLQGIQNIKNSQDLSAEQKETILVRSAARHAKNMEIRKRAAKDIPAVQPHMATLGKLFE